MATKKYYNTKTTLTGGGATALDSIDGTDLDDGFEAHVFVSGIAYVYILDADSGAAESSPTIIAPDTNAGNKRWLLQGTYANGIKDSSLSASLPVFTDADKKLVSKTAANARAALYQTYKSTVVTLAGQTGITVTHNKGDTSYIVSVMPKDTLLGSIGDISVVKASNTVVIYNTGFSGILADVEIRDIA